MTNEAEIKKRDERPSIKNREKSSRTKAKPLTKVIVRRLPPTMSEEEFFQQIDPMPDCESYYYCMADWSLGQDATCRAYLNFKNQDDIFLFKDRFDGYVFVDNKGVEYPALVEYAPFQGLPKNRSRKRDPKTNTIETDQHYINFLEKLKNEENEKSEMKLEFNLQTTKDAKITSTPLLQYVANKMQEKRDEKKRKADERKQRREEVRQKKKLIIAQKVPPAIKEEESKSKETRDNQVKEKSIEKRDNFNNRNDDRKERNDNSDRKDRNDRNNRDNRNNRNERNDRERQERERRNEERREKERKRRQERDEKRRQEREKRDRERRDKKYQDDKQPKEIYTEISSKDAESTKRVEVKKYSESRKDKMKSREDNKYGNNDLSKTKVEINRSDSISSDKNSTTSNSQSGDINENVKDFIMSAAMARDFNPKLNEIRISEIETKEISGSSENEKTTIKNLHEVNEKLEKISLDESNNKKEGKISEKQEICDNEKISQDYDALRSSRRGSRSSSSANERNDKFSKDDRENRRIRNKDRPSIQIYQPGRLRLARAGSDGRASVEPKETKSNPTSDGETNKKVEKMEKKDESGVKRKVSRYSERTRSGRVREKSEKSESDKNGRRKSESSISLTEKELEGTFENLVLAETKPEDKTENKMQAEIEAPIEEIKKTEAAE